MLASLSFREPDRVPLDLGGSIMSGIMAQALDALRRHLGLEERPVRVYEVFQMLGEVKLSPEGDWLLHTRATPAGRSRGAPRRRWRTWTGRGATWGTTSTCWAWTARTTARRTPSSVTRLLPLLIEAGVDILNPPQTSAAAYDTAREAGRYPLG